MMKNASQDIVPKLNKSRAIMQESPPQPRSPPNRQAERQEDEEMQNDENVESESVEE